MRRELQIGGRRLPEAGRLGETDDARAVAGRPAGEALATNSRACFRAAAEMLAESSTAKSTASSREGSSQRSAGQREHEEQQDERAQGEADAPLRGRQVGERAALRPDEQDDDEREREKPGMREFDACRSFRAPPVKEPPLEREERSAAAARYCQSGQPAKLRERDARAARGGAAAARRRMRGGRTPLR